MMPPRPPSSPLPPDVIAMLPVARMSAIGPISLPSPASTRTMSSRSPPFSSAPVPNTTSSRTALDARLHRRERVGRVADLVDEPELLRARRGVRTVLDRLGDPRLRAALRDRLEPRGAHVDEHAGERRARLGARSVARERLLRALELADLQHVDRQVQLVGEETPHVEDLRGEADRLDLAGGRHVDARAAAGRGHDRRVRERVTVAVDLLLLLELLEVLADLLRARRADARAPELHEDADGPLVRADLGDRMQELVEALLASDAAEEARRLVLGDAAAEIEDRDRRARPARGLGRLAVRRGCRRADGPRIPRRGGCSS